MRRFFPRLMSILPALIFLTIVVLWVRSYAFGDDVFVVFEDGCERVALLRGLVLVQQFRPEARGRGKWLRLRWHTQAAGAMAPQPWPQTLPKYRWLGVRYVDLPSPNPVNPGLPSYWAAVVPYWLLCAAVLPWSSVWLARRIRRLHRRSNHLCLDCGYDLTGNTTGICSECGTRTTRSKSSFVAEQQLEIRGGGHINSSFKVSRAWPFFLASRRI